jgi:hypothetical protein|tara:strand:- start:64 stop:321 length:258 start_codon:yes stop_codon:yes gene_type:complete
MTCSLCSRPNSIYEAFNEAVCENCFKGGLPFDVKPITLNQVKYNYELQVWVKNGIIQPCGHPDTMKTNGHCCDQDKFKGLEARNI